MIKGIVFDMDGVMFDTERLAADGWRFAFSQARLYISDEFINKAIGLNEYNTQLIFAENYGADIDYRLLRKLGVEYVKDFIERNGMPIKSGLFELLNYLKANDYKFTVATSTESEKVRYYFEKSGVDEYFRDIVCGDMIRRGKPEPDIYLKACEILGVDPEHCLALEDSPCGIMSAFRAGIKVAMIPDLISPNDDIKRLLFTEVPTLSHIKVLLSNTTP